MKPVPILENVPIRDLPAYTGCYEGCWVHSFDYLSHTEYENFISEEEVAFLRNLWYKHKHGLRIESSLADKVKNLEEKKLIWREKKNFILSVLASKAEYTLVPRRLFSEPSRDA